MKHTNPTTEAQIRENEFIEELNNLNFIFRGYNKVHLLRAVIDEIITLARKYYFDPTITDQKDI